MIGSTAGKFGEAFHLDYAASKSAMMYGFMKSLKNEIVYIFPRAIVNTVAPGWVHTKMAEQSIAEGKHLKALKTMPLRKLATVEDVSNAVLVASSPVTCTCHLSRTS
jgi:NAD(P)-dependent dehydrogenase (short-subunit alcohol dehydrogenase family)